MERFLAATLWALLPAFSALAGSPCEPMARRDTHQPGWARGMRPPLMSEIEIQRRCLLWEWSVEPKAEPIPPSRSVVFFDARDLPAPFRGAPRTQAAADLFATSGGRPQLGLGLTPGAIR